MHFIYQLAWLCIFSFHCFATKFPLVIFTIQVILVFIICCFFIIFFVTDIQLAYFSILIFFRVTFVSIIAVSVVLLLIFDASLCSFSHFLAVLLSQIIIDRAVSAKYLVFTSHFFYHLFKFQLYSANLSFTHLSFFLDRFLSISQIQFVLMNLSDLLLIFALI